MWPFKKKSKADKALAVMEEATGLVAEKWRYFSTTLAFKNGVKLDEQISLFSVPMMGGLRKTFPVLEDSPDQVVFLYILVGIEKSGTLPPGAVAEAFNIPFSLSEALP